MRIGKTRYKSHNAVEKEIIELHTRKLIIDESKCFDASPNDCLFIFNHKHNNDYHVLQIGDNDIISHIYISTQINRCYFKKKERKH